MPSELYSAIGSDKNVSTNQDPKEAAMNRMKEMGISIPKGMENNPQALIQHVMSSGRVPNNRLNMAQQVMQRMFGRH
ncbi:hypothetical protein [Ruminococcus flavefaciens]|uniref:hypothetical protein n=1 Tax=Ruminococcus flavefaciens TaxID=1265 RepID=UPI0026ED70BF|nr:hypothetical protein [Ruminococcus flavefaciens]